MIGAKQFARAVVAGGLLTGIVVMVSLARISYSGTPSDADTEININRCEMLYRV